MCVVENTGEYECTIVYYLSLQDCINTKHSVRRRVLIDQADMKATVRVSLLLLVTAGNVVGSEERRPPNIIFV